MMTKTATQFFALRRKSDGALMGFDVDSNDGAEFCTSTCITLCPWADNLWTVRDRTVAEKAAATNTEWFNAGFETPRNGFVGQLEVVELKVS